MGAPMCATLLLFMLGVVGAHGGGYREVRDRWCCVTEMPRGPLGYERCEGLVYTTHRPFEEALEVLLGSWEVVGVFLSTVVTNAAFVPAIARACERGLAYEVSNVVQCVVVQRREPRNLRDRAHMPW